MPRFPVTAGAGMDVLDKIVTRASSSFWSRASMHAGRRVLPAEVARALCRGTFTSFTEVSWPIDVVPSLLADLSPPSEVSIGTACVQASHPADVLGKGVSWPIDPVASLLADLSPPYSSIPSVASLPAVLSPHLIQRLSSEVSIGTVCMQAWHPSARAYTLAADLCSQSLPRRSSTYHHHVSYRGFSSGNAEYATKAEVSGNAEYATKAEVVKLEHKLDLVKREFESMIELVKQEKKQIETLFDAHKLKTKADVMAVQNSVLKTYATVVSTVVTIVLGGIAIYEFEKHFGSTKNNAMTTDEQK